VGPSISLGVGGREEFLLLPLDRMSFSLSREITKQLNDLNLQPNYTFIKLFEDDLTSVKFEVSSVDIIKNTFFGDMTS
jgi:hypothetical protein